MHNRFLDDRTSRDIDLRIAKVLKDLGNPQPPLRLELVRELLTLDRAYYSASDSGALAETIHRLKMAGKQVLLRPALLLDVVKKLDLKALWVPDRKRILIDAELPPAKQRWGEAHEIGHSVLPWHEAVMHGDKKRTLSLACEQQVEAEANYAAGRLLFMQELFAEQLRGSPLDFGHVKKLSGTFGNTMTSTLWRAVESVVEPVFGLVSQHPRHALGEEPLRYFIRSRSFETQFSTVTAQDIFTRLKTICRGGRGPIGQDEVVFADAVGGNHVFYLETFFNTHDALTLGVYNRVRAVSVSV
ncbi:MAG: ImmA/IrrE family metallo-endopeptidase [Planctomycetales bacterium]|nr:ImmA/IrrE family metallo-endopeptidase [Planctomycetales bacterium]MBN8625557.1 ImmA/IrrE family metallo-endopeptidase [Planctomycetota bacterium]